MKGSIEIGDLVCYNAAGQREKSLGLVLDRYITTANGKVKGYDVFYHIYWTRKPDLMPRAEWSSPREGVTTTLSELDQKGPKNWYRCGGWFEKIKTDKKCPRQNQ